MPKILERIPLFSYFGQVLTTATFKQSSITFIGTALTGGLGAVFYIVAARILGPADFGLFNVAITTLTLTTDIGDLGTDTGMVNFIPRYLENDPIKAEKFMKLGLTVKIIVSLVVIISGFFLAPFLAVKILNKPELTSSLRIAFIGVSALLLFSFVVRILQTYQKFWTWSIIQIATNTLRLFLIFIIFIWGILNLESTIWIYILIPFFGFVAGLFLISTSFLRVKRQWDVAKEFFSYNKWVASFVLLSAVSSRLDTFISARLLEPLDLGIYSAAQQLVKIIPMIVGALGTVIAPKMSSMGSIKELITYFKKTQVMVLGLALLGIMSIPVVLWLISPIFGVEYASAGPYFVVLLFAMLVFLISVPVHMSIFYYFSYPKLFLWLSMGHLLIVAGLGWVLISNYGVMGAATTVLMGQLFNFIIPLIWVWKKFKKINKAI